jgi:hypothetical protein
MEPDVAAISPAKILQTLPEGGEVGLPDLIVFSEAHDHADAPHSVLLLCARGERAEHCRAGEQCDQVASL